MNNFIELTDGEEIYLINVNQIVCVMPVASAPGCTIVLTNYMYGKNVLNLETVDYYYVKKLISE